MLKWYITVPLSLLLICIYMLVQASVYATRHYNMNFGAGLRFLHLSDIHINLLVISSARIKELYEKQIPITY